MTLLPTRYSSYAANVRGSLHNLKRGMVRIGVNITDQQLENVRSFAVANGFSVAGAVRHLIDRGLSAPLQPGYRNPCSDPRDC